MRNPAFENSGGGFDQNSYGDFDDSGHGAGGGGGGGVGVNIPPSTPNEQWYTSSPTVSTKIITPLQQNTTLFSLIVLSYSFLTMSTRFVFILRPRREGIKTITT